MLTDARRSRSGQLRYILAAVAALLATYAAGAEGTFDSNGTSIHFIDEGQGAPVLLLHGQNASADSSWTSAGVVANLAKDYRVIALDFRGHGKSAKPHDASAYGHQVYLDAIRLLDHLGVRKPNFVGYSL